MAHNTIPGRLLWGCRRGIREMDLLLQDFLTQHYATLDPAMRDAFEYLLEQSDLDILSWINGVSSPTDARLSAVIALLQKTLPYMLHTKNSN